MKKYQTLFFDLDDTLLDFQATERLGLRSLFEEQNIPLTDQIEAQYKTINHGLWRSFEEGEISRDEVVNTRFSILFKALNREVDGIFLEKRYRTYLEESTQLVNGAIELLTSLQDQYDLYIVTNGVSKTQYKRLQDSGLHPIFKGVFVSEDTGFQKPMREFFNYVFARIPHFAAERALIIGDSLTSDIKGGNLVGVDTCWYNPEMKPNHTNIIPTYEIKNLGELNQILI